MQIPADANGLTAEWLSDVLAVADGGPFGPVARVQRRRIGEGAGVLTEIYRLSITYAPGGRPGPPSLVVKLPGAAPEARALSDNYGFYEREVAFYRDIAQTVSVRAPACFGAAFDTQSRLFVLLLEDLAAASPIQRLAGMTEVQVRQVVHDIVPLHARWWRDPQLPALESVIPAHGQPPWDSIGQMHTAAWAVVAPWLKSRIGPDMMRIGERLCSDIQGLFDRNGQGQRTLCHGDFHGDNMMLAGDPADPRVTVLDWQILVQAPGTFDVGYLMSNSVTPDLRRNLEMDLLAGYHADLVTAGVDGYGFDECLEDYRRALLLGFTYVVQAGSVVNLEDPTYGDLINTLAVRSEAASRDLGLAALMN